MEKKEKEIVKEAVKDFFVRNYVKVKGISTTLKILLNADDYETVKNIVSNSILKKTSKKEKEILEEKLKDLKPEVMKKIVNNITNGEKLFLEMLYKEMSKSDPQEFEKLSSILEGLE